MSKAEKFISDCTRNCSNIIVHRTQYGGVDEHQPWLAPDQARKAVEIAREEMTEKAIKWVEYNNENGGCKFDGWEDDFKNYMKGK